MEKLRELLNLSADGNTVKDYFVAMGALLVFMVVLYFLREIVVKRLKVIVKRTKTDFDDFLVSIVEDISPLFLVFISFYLSISVLTVKESVQPFINAFIVVVLTIQICRALQMLAVYAIDKIYKRGANKDLPKKALINILKGVIWGGAGAFILDNLGFDITAVVAGLGISGIAIALAAQSFLGDAFSGLFIMIDKPFKVGDFIIVDDYLGCVESIGFKTTRIRSLFGEQLVFSNSDLTSSRIKNYKRMEQRRVCFEIGVTYQTPLEKLKKIPGSIKQVVEGIDKAKFDRAHFKEYGDFSLNYEIVFYVLGNDYNLYMDIQQEINFKIHEAFDKEGIEFAYPTQTIFMAKE